jgi:hypothetical protein
MTCGHGAQARLCPPYNAGGRCERRHLQHERAQIPQEGRRDEIEQAVRDAAASGKLKSGALPAKATFTIGGVNLTFDVTGEVETG